MAKLNNSGEGSQMAYTIKLFTLSLSEKIGVLITIILKRKSKKKYFNNLGRFETTITSTKVISDKNTTPKAKYVSCTEFILSMKTTK